MLLIKDSKTQTVLEQSLSLKNQLKSVIKAGIVVLKEEVYSENEVQAK